jgi:anti-anti-sigma factor
VEAPEHFRCAVHEEGTAAFVELHGELDIETIEAVQETMVLAATAKRRVTLDLRGLRFIDSSGLNLIIQMAALGRTDGFEFSVIPATDPNVRGVFTATGAERFIAFVDPPGDLNGAR